MKTGKRIRVQRIRHSTMLIAGWAGSLLCANRDQAATTWKVNDGSWQVPGNWSGGLPTKSIDAIIDRSTTHQITVTGTAAAKTLTQQSGALTLNIMSGASLTTPLNLAPASSAAASLTIAMGPGATYSGAVQVAESTGQIGTLTLSQGLFNPTSATIGSSVGHGYCDIDVPGTTFAPSALYVSAPPDADPSVPQFHLSGGATASVGPNEIGAYSGGGFELIEGPGTTFFSNDVVTVSDGISSTNLGTSSFDVSDHASASVASLILGEDGGKGQANFSNCAVTVKNSMNVGLFPEWQSPPTLAILGSGTADLNASSLSCGTSLYVGSAGAFGTMRVHDGSILSCGKSILIGSGSATGFGENYGGVGTMIVDSSQVSAGGLQIGVGSLSSGTFIVGGTGATVHLIGLIELGGLVPDVVSDLGSGRLIVNDAANVTCDGTLIVQTGSEVDYQNGTLNVATIQCLGSIQISPGARRTLITKNITMPAQLYQNGIAGVIDVTDNAIVVDYDGASPASTIRNFIANARANGSWNGTGITSTLAAAIAADGHNIHKTAVGYAEASSLNLSSYQNIPLDSSALLIRYAYLGDSNLDGTVGSSDFALLAANYGKTGQSWINGDYNYDGTVNALDFNALASNYGQSISSADLPDATLPFASALVPEPAVGFFPILLALHVRRRKLAQNSYGNGLPSRLLFR